MIPAGSPIAGMNRVLPPDVGADPKLAGDLSALFSGGARPSTEAPADPYSDDAALLTLFKDFHKLCFDQRWSFERLWWRNLLYTLGRQWIYYNQQRGAWADKRMQKWIPRPVTNKIAETVDAMRSVFQSVELSVKCRPISDDPTDTQTSETAENLAPALHAEHDMAFRLFESDFWTITTGNAFWHTWFDKRAEHGMLMVPFERCEQCQETAAPSEIVAAGHTCPKCGSPNFVPAVDEQGQPIGNEYPVGKGATDVCSVFELGIPGGYQAFDDVPGLIRQRWRTREYYERYYPDLLPQLKFEKMANERSLQLLKSLASQSDVSSSALSAQSSESSVGDGIVEYELWLKPTKTYPRGLLLRVAGNPGSEVILRTSDEQMPGPLPSTTVKGQPIFPWIHVGYHRFGGRIWARSPLDLLIQKQDQINQLDSLMLLGVQRMSNPVWLEPKGAEVKKFTGEPGLVVKYNPLIAGGNAKPERIEGQNIPPSLLRLREQFIQDLESLAGTQDVLKGAKPAGVSAFSAMQLLVERAQSRFGPVLAERGEAYRKWFALALEIERQYGPDERTYAAMGANRRWTFSKFKNADIQGSVKVLIEDGSQAPKTNLGKRAAVEQLRQLGLLDPNDPDQRIRIYQVFGQTDLMPALNAAVQGALAEQSAFEEWAMSPGSMPQPAMPQPGMPMPGMQPGAMPNGPSGQPPQGRAYFDDAEGAGGAPPAPAGPPPPPVPAPTMSPCPLVVEEWHPDPVHISEHEKWANSDVARQLFAARPDVKLQFTLHLMQHKQRAALAMMQQAAPAGPPPGTGDKAAGGARAMQNSNQESGKRGANQAPPA